MHHRLKNAQILMNVVCFCANQDRNFAIELKVIKNQTVLTCRNDLTCRNEGATPYICRFQMHSLSATINNFATF